MRESTFSFAHSNKACICISSALYDRRGKRHQFPWAFESDGSGRLRNFFIPLVVIRPIKVWARHKAASSRRCSLSILESQFCLSDAIAFGALETPVRHTPSGVGARRT